MPDFIFIVDTHHYAGSFERAMCAYITGQIGECGVGQLQARMAQAELPRRMLTWFEDNVAQRADEHGCDRPCSIWSTPGYFNDGMGNVYKDDEDPEVVRRKYAEIPDDEKQFPGSKQPGHYPSYQSVAVFLDVKPRPGILNLMQQRAIKFAATEEQFRPKIPLIGFRLIAEEKSERILYENKIERTK